METKVCKTCKEVKPASEYSITNKQYGTLKSYCKPCANKMGKEHREANPNYMKDWNAKNPDYMKEYFKNNPGENMKSVRKQATKIPAGIYYIYEKNELVYIGESGTPNRRIKNHFSVRRSFKKDWKISNVSHALTIGEVKREDLSYKMFKFIDDEDERRELEAKLIAKHKPKYNTIGC